MWDFKSHIYYNKELYIIINGKIDKISKFTEYSYTNQEIRDIKNMEILKLMNNESIYLVFNKILNIGYKCSDVFMKKD